MYSRRIHIVAARYFENGLRDLVLFLGLSGLNAYADGEMLERRNMLCDGQYPIDKDTVIRDA